MTHVKRIVVAAIIVLTVLAYRNVVVADTTPRAEKRVALVIGIGDYKSAPKLTNPPNDARLIASKLKEAGFKLVGDRALVDLDRNAFANALNDFSALSSGADVAVFYYAGHGMQLLDTNWLLPVSANPEKPSDLSYQAIDIGDVLTRLERSEAKFKIVLLDACRNNPFVGRGLRGATGTGLMRIDAPDGTLISYSTKPGHVAQDGTGLDSPYATQLATIMSQPGVPVLSMFNQLGVAVKRATDGNQEPWLTASPIEHEFMFMPQGGQAAGSGSTVGATQLASLPSGSSPGLSKDPGDAAGRPIDGGVSREADPPAATGPDIRIFEWIDTKRPVARDVDVFGAPVSGASTLALLPAGTQVFVVGVIVGAEWLQIRMPDNATIGYVLADRLPEIADAGPPDTAPSAPPPTPKLTYLMSTRPPPPPISGRPIVHDTATLLIDDHVVPLSGIEGYGGGQSAGLQQFLSAKGDFVTCQPGDPGRFVCITRDKTDIATAALLNGAAKAAPGAPSTYADRQAEAQRSGRGIWAPTVPPPPKPDPLPPSAVYAAGAPAPAYIAPVAVSAPVDVAASDYEVAEIDGQPMTVIDGERVVVVHDARAGWGYRDAAGAMHAAPSRLDHDLDHYYRSRPLPVATAGIARPQQHFAPSTAPREAFAANRPRPSMAFAAPPPVSGARSFAQGMNQRVGAPAAGSGAHAFSQNMSQRMVMSGGAQGMMGQRSGGVPARAAAPAAHACKKGPC
jgi:hypothetical protein